MLKAVLFDLDGTLLNRDASLSKFIASHFNSLQDVLTDVDEQQFCSRFIELDNRGYVWKDQVYQQLIKEYNIEGLTAEDLLHYYIHNFKQHCVAFPNLYSMLKELKQMPLTLGIITNGKGQFQLDNIHALGIESFFDVILISETEGIKKPDPQIFHRALSTLSVSPHECAYVGDHPINDIRGANAVGIQSIWKKDPDYHCLEANHVIDDLSEIPSIIKSLIK